eukprot:TRINITY_DN22990_c0_g1_i1.p1 TRINITY_DN22990_c0_g1~~TRINITY_DN22990_c0_g1_i1.p1  ORF type:complete len:168 (-),score=44.60 TRINITY_DN22990_c0_g1_i1:102-566(-)
MDQILEETVDTQDLKKFEQKYHEELNSGKVNSITQFEYAWCLVRSKYSADIKKGIDLLEDLFQRPDEDNKRDYLFYLAIGNTKLKEYSTALKYCRALLQVEPGNRQAQELEEMVNKKLKHDGMVGMAVAGGTAVAFGGLVGLGLALGARAAMRK